MAFDFDGFDAFGEIAAAHEAEAARARSASFLTRRDSGRLEPVELLRRLDQIEAAVRNDRWVNYATGLGTSEDKTRQAHFESPWRLTDQEITSLVAGNPIAAKIVEKRAFEMFRRG